MRGSGSGKAPLTPLRFVRGSGKAAAYFANAACTTLTHKGEGEKDIDLPHKGEGEKDIDLTHKGEGEKEPAIPQEGGGVR